MRLWIVLVARDKKAQVRCKARGAGGNQTFGEPLDQGLGLLGTGAQVQELPSAANTHGKALVPPQQPPRAGFAVPFPCPVSNWVCSRWLQPRCAPEHCRPIAVCADCLWRCKLDYEGVCQSSGLSKCLSILETSAVSQLLQAWPARLLGKSKGSLIMDNLI